MTADSIEFITLAEAITIHEDQIERHGGNKGIRDMHLLTPALALPRAAFDGRSLCKNIFETAAAYAYHICQNHPFIDGNKRVALVTALVFLEFNGVRINDPRGRLYDIMMDISHGNKGKKELESLFRKLSG